MIRVSFGHMLLVARIHPCSLEETRFEITLRTRCQVFHACQNHPQLSDSSYQENFAPRKIELSARIRISKDFSTTRSMEKHKAHLSEPIMVIMTRLFRKSLSFNSNVEPCNRYHFRYGPNKAYVKGVYANDDEYFADVAKAYQTELKILYDAGLRNAQVDDPNLACTSSNLLSLN